MEKIIILDYGSQYCHLISRRIRDLGVLSEVFSAEFVENLHEISDIKGIILSGGAASVYDKDALEFEEKLLKLNVPILGICYGHQLLGKYFGGEVIKGESGEYGTTELIVKNKSALLNGLADAEQVWMNHQDIVKSLPSEFEATASTKNSEIAVFENYEKKIFGIQFHPEVSHSTNGLKILENFALKICNIKKEWQSEDLANLIVEEARTKLGGKRAIIGLSGGIDSTVAAMLVKDAIGKNLTAVYVDTGLMRLGETKDIQQEFKQTGIDLVVVNAGEIFFNSLKNVIDPEEKRKIIGKTFIDIFSKIAKEKKAEVLIQGTIYSDRIESGVTKHSATIKSHHNVGGLPKDMNLEIYEPLRDLYKDEVRRLASAIGVSQKIIKRHVFPGPGLAIRIIGEVTLHKAEIVRRASFIVEAELENAGLHEKVWMGFAVLLNVKSVGIQGDDRSYKFTIAVRILESTDAMTANFAQIPFNVLEKISTRITNEIKEVNRVVYDITNKPPGTMEWE